MLSIYIATALALLVSFIFNRQKTFKALQMALKKMGKILPEFVLVSILVALALFFVPDSVISKYLGGQTSPFSFLIALGLGSIVVMPGFIAFPLAAVLIDKGVSYVIIAAFTTSLMVVGVATFPIEQKYLGTYCALTRNIIGLIIAALVSICIGLCYGELL